MVGYGDRDTYQALWGDTIAAAKFNARDTEYYYMINNYIFGDPQTTTTDTEDLALIQSVAHKLHDMAFTYAKARAMAEPPDFLSYKAPHLTDEMKATLDVIKMNRLKTNTKLMYISD